MSDLEHPAFDVFAAARTRRSIRAYKADPVPIAILREIVALGRHAPSGSNIQPWHVHVLTGATLGRVGTAIRQAFLNADPDAAVNTFQPPRIALEDYAVFLD